MGESIKGAASWFFGAAGFGAFAAAVIFHVVADTCRFGSTSITYDCVATLNLEQFIAANGTGLGAMGAVIGWLISES
jgi:hypothetical protein